MSFQQSETTRHLLDSVKQQYMIEEKDNIQFELTDELIEQVELLVAKHDDKTLKKLLNEFHYADVA